jgi:hypothetical protein
MTGPGSHWPRPATRGDGPLALAVAGRSSQERRTEPPDGDLPLDVRQRLHSQVPFGLPVIAIVPVMIAVVLATTLAPAASEPRGCPDAAKHAVGDLAG